MCTNCKYCSGENNCKCNNNGECENCPNEGDSCENVEDCLKVDTTETYTRPIYKTKYTTLQTQFKEAVIINLFLLK